MGSEQESSDPDGAAALGAALDFGECFETLVQGLARPMGERAFRILGDRAQAEEVVQEALLEMWLHRGDYDPVRGSPAGWALAIVRHLAVDRVRSEQAAARRDTLFAARQADTPYDEVVDAVERIHDHERIRWLLGELTAVQRQAVELVYFGHLSVGQVAERLRIPVATLRTRLRDARRALESILGDD